MRLRSLLTTCILALVVLVSCRGRQEALIGPSSVEEALAVAAKTDAMVLIEFWADG
jgi:hypothetical protein